MSVTKSRYFLLISVVVAIFFCEISSYDACSSYKKYGFETRESCLTNLKTRKFFVKKIAKGIANKAASFVVGGVLKAYTHFNKKKLTQANVPGGVLDKAALLLVNKAMSPKKKLSMSVINKEPGFDLSKEEMEKFKIWDRGVIPYFIDEYSFDKVLRDRIRSNLDEVNTVTGVQFMEIPRPPDDPKTRYVFFINRRAVLNCVDHTTNDFSNEGIQKVVLGYDCIDLNSGMAATILTLLGVAPQHNAPNRNFYISVLEENILPDKKDYFKKLENTDWLFHEIDYDFDSASHYHFHKYSAGGKSTIFPKYLTETGPVGEIKPLSDNDILKIKMLYNYISKVPSNAKRTECSSMFQPGTGFSKYNNEKDKVQPREKPAKYLGTDPFAEMDNDYKEGEQDEGAGEGEGEDEGDYSEKSDDGENDDQYTEDNEAAHDDAFAKLETTKNSNLTKIKKNKVTSKKGYEAVNVEDDPTRLIIDRPNKKVDRVAKQITDNPTKLKREDKLIKKNLKDFLQNMSDDQTNEE